MHISFQETIIVIPCYQEASRLATGRFDEFINRRDGVGFVFVDDCSTDTTAMLVQQLADRHPGRIACLHNTVNLGKGGAIRNGVLYAQDKADYIGYWDADLSTPLDLIPDFIALLRERNALMVIGSRIKIAGHEVRRRARRHYPGRIFAALASLIIGQGIYDTQCGAKLFRNNIVADCFGLPFLSRWCFDIELIFRLIDHYGLEEVNTPDSRLLELPLRRWIDEGDSRIHSIDVLHMVTDLARIYYKYRLNHGNRTG